MGGKDLTGVVPLLPGPHTPPAHSTAVGRAGAIPALHAFHKSLKETQEKLVNVNGT